MRALKFIAYCLIFLALLVWFFPKINLYYFAEQKLLPYKITINNETASENLLFLDIKNAQIFYGAAEAANVEKIRIKPFILYNEIELEGVNMGKSYQNIVPNPINTIQLKYTLFYPVKVWIDINGDFGTIGGSCNLYSKNCRLVLEDNGELKRKYPFIYANFKDIEGQLIYESSF